MRCLEIYAGTGSFAATARASGDRVVTLDISAKHGPDICADILLWDHTVYEPGAFDFIWASVPCESFSRARSTGGARPLERADALVKRTLDILAYFRDALWVVENPAGSLLWQRPVAAPWKHMRAMFPRA